jgi:hypothetical protein
MYQASESLSGSVRRVSIALLGRDHVGSEDHRLQIQPPAVRQQASDAGEERLIDGVLAPGAVVLRRAEVLEGTEARHGVEGPELLTSDLPRVSQVDVETVPPAGGRLGGGERQADAHAPPAADERKQRSPTAAEVEHTPVRPDPDLLGHKLMLASLGLLEGQREVAVVLRPAEVGELAEAEPEDAIGE